MTKIVHFLGIKEVASDPPEPIDRCHVVCAHCGARLSTVSGRYPYETRNDLLAQAVRETMRVSGERADRGEPDLPLVVQIIMEEGFDK